MEAFSLCLRVTQVSISLFHFVVTDSLLGTRSRAETVSALMTWLCWLAWDSLGRFCKPPVKSIPAHPASSFNFLRPISSKHLPFREVFMAEETHQRLHNTVLVGERQILYLVCSQPFTCLQNGCPGIWHQRLWRALSSSKEKPGVSLPSNFYLHINEDALH